LATEVLVATTAVRSIIRDNNLPQLHTILQTGKRQGMHTMDESLRRLYETAQITYEAAIAHARDAQFVKGEYRVARME